MKISEAITQVDRVKPNQYETAEKVRWISTLDGKITHELHNWHECSDRRAHHGRDRHQRPEHGDERCRERPIWRNYDPQQDMDTELLVPDPYSDVYLHWLGAQIDYNNSEMARYNNSMTMFNVAYATYADWYNRAHKPRQDNHVRLSL